jgi:flavin-dependent dehydrogenase
MLLARKGLDVLLVDRANFPRDIPHGHFIHLHGPRRLADWGLLDRILATNCPPVTTMTVGFEGRELTGRDLEVNGIPMGVAPRRDRCDQVLLEAAVEAGAELRAGFAVQELLRDGDRVVGVRGPGGVEERAALVIGADGRNSGVARAVEAPLTESGPALTCWYFSYWSGMNQDALQIRVRDERATFVFPTNDGLTGVFVAWPLDELPRVKADVEGEVMKVVDNEPELAERVRAGTREERFYGATQLPNFIRKPIGDGWALVGDAGCHKDPFLALGMCDALRDAELLSEAVVADDLPSYQARRDEATLPEYHENLAAAQLEPPSPETMAVLEQISSQQDAVNAFFLAREGMVPATT